MAEIDDVTAFASGGILQHELPLSPTPWTGAERAGFFAALGLLGTGGLPAPAEALVGGLMSFGTKMSED